VNPPRVIAASALAALVVAAGCSSSVRGSGTSASSPPTSDTGSTVPSTSSASASASASGSASAAASASAGSQSGFPTDVQALAALLSTGNASIKTARLSLAETVGAQRIAGVGDEKLSDGRLQAVDLTERVGRVRLRFIVIGDRLYARVPAAIYPSSKPWVEITSSTTNRTLKSLYDSFENSVQFGAGRTVQIFLSAAKNVRMVGVERFDGAPVGHYAITIDVASLPSDYPNRDVLVQSGLTSIPADIYIDTQGRTRKVTENLTVGSQHVTSVITLTRIDQPVHIGPPPSRLVEHA
jgi:hypothetical protein